MLRIFRTLAVPVAVVSSLSVFFAGRPALGEDEGWPARDDKPFAEAFIVLQLSDQDPVKQDTVLTWPTT